MSDRRNRTENDEPAPRWFQIEPRRMYRCEIKDRWYDLGYRGRAAAPQIGWYFLGSKGGEFMARRLQDAIDEATKVVLAIERGERQK